MISRQRSGEIPINAKAHTDFGGHYLKNSHAKTARPISSKKPMQLVMRSSQAKGRRSLLLQERLLRKTTTQQGRVFGVRVLNVAIAGNHLQLLIVPCSRRAFLGFVRAISGIIARLVLRAQRGAAKGLRFWDQRPFSRVLSWGEEFRKLSLNLENKSFVPWGFRPFLLKMERPAFSTG